MCTWATAWTTAREPGGLLYKYRVRYYSIIWSPHGATRYCCCCESTSERLVFAMLCGKYDKTHDGVCSIAQQAHQTHTCFAYLHVIYHIVGRKHYLCTMLCARPIAAEHLCLHLYFELRSQHICPARVRAGAGAGILAT